MFEKNKDLKQQKFEASLFKEINKLTEQQEPVRTQVALQATTMKVTRTFSVEMKD